MDCRLPSETWVLGRIRGGGSQNLCFILTLSIAGIRLRPKPGPEARFVARCLSRPRVAHLAVFKSEGSRSVFVGQVVFLLFVLLFCCCFCPGVLVLERLRVVEGETKNKHKKQEVLGEAWGAKAKKLHMCWPVPTTSGSSRYGPEIGPMSQRIPAERIPIERT